MLDIIAGYNKASLKTNNYKNGDKVFPRELGQPLYMMMRAQTSIMCLGRTTSKINVQEPVFG